MKGLIRPMLLLILVIVMIAFAQTKIEEKKELEIQKETIDESSVIYSDIGV